MIELGEAFVVRMEKAAARMEDAVNRQEHLLEAAKRLALLANEQTDDLMECWLKLNELSKANAVLLRENSTAITEKAIHDELRAYEERVKRKERFYEGYPGIARKLLKQSS